MPSRTNGIPRAKNWLAFCVVPPLFGSINSRPNGPGDCKRDFILHRGDGCKIAVVAFRPDVIAVLHFDRLCNDVDQITAKN